MSTALKSKALKNLNTSQTSKYYAFLEETKGFNPMTQQFEKDLNEYINFVKKFNSGTLKSGEHLRCKM